MSKYDLERARIREKLANDEILTETEAFIHVCDDDATIEQYIKFEEIKERTSQGFITPEDLDYLIKTMDIKDEYMESLLKNVFIYKGLVKPVEPENSPKTM